MHHSSIFSFKSYKARWRLSSWVLYFLLFIGLAEGALRVPAVANSLPSPEPTLWHAALIQYKMDYLKAFEISRGIDTLFIGNSATQAGISPQIFDETRGNGYTEKSGSFNAGIEGLPPYGMSMFLEIYLRYTQPKTIIYGLTPQDLNSNSPWAKDVTDRVKHSPLALAESRRGWQGQTLAFFLEYSVLFRYRFLLHQLLLRGGILPKGPDVYFDAQGFHPINHSLAEVPQAQRAIYYNRAGVLNYSVDGEQLDSFRQLIEYCAAHKIQLILVNMPLTDDYYGNFDSLADYQTYLSTAKTMATEYHVPFWDMESLTPPNSFDDTHFADFNHLNQNGAEKLSKLLGTQYVELVAANSAVGMQ